MRYLFSIGVEADSKEEAIEKFQYENINPTDMDIDEVCEEKSFTIVGFYGDTNQKYAGHHITETAEEAEKEAIDSGVTVCGIFEGSHNTVAQEQ